MDKPEYEEISLETIGGGAAPELFKRELDAVLQNIVDLNTAPKAKRKITVEIVISPTEDRAMGEVQINCYSKMARVKPAAATMYLMNKGKHVKAYHHNHLQPELPGNVTQLPTEEARQ